MLNKFLKIDLSRSNRGLQIVNVLFSFAVSFGLVSALAGLIRVWDSGGQVIFSSSRYSFLLAMALVLLSLYLIAFNWRALKFELEGFVWGLLALFFTDWLCRDYNFLQGPEVRGNIILGAIVFFALFKRANHRFWEVFLCLSLVTLALAFFVRSDGRIIWSDDHSTFFYRFQLLKDNFPKIVFFNPQWNSGLVAGDLIATGVLNVFLIFAPLVYLFDIESSYNFIVVLLLFFLTPGLMYLAANVAGLNRSAAAIASLLSVSGGLLWYKWALKYGTMGFITTIALLPLVLVLSLKIISKDEIKRWHALLFVIASTLMLQWAPSAVPFIPIAVWGLVSFKQIIKKRLVPLVILAFVLLNASWVYVLFTHTNVGNFFAEGSFQNQERIVELEDGTKVVKKDSISARTRDPKITDDLSFKSSLSVIRESAASTNPLILLFAIPGMLLLPLSIRAGFVASSVFLVVVGGIVSLLFPEMELSRMLLVLSQILCLPVACALVELLNKIQNFESRSPNMGYGGLSVLAAHGRTLLLSCFAFGFLFSSPLSAHAILWNRSLHHFHFMPKSFENLAQAIEESAGDGRVLFAGFVLHDYWGAHIAPLAEMTSKPMVAISHVHNVWRYHESIPQIYVERGDEGVTEYLNLRNISAIVTHDGVWREYYQSRAHQYEKVWSAGKFNLFKRINFRPSYFYQGEGEVLNQSSSSVLLKLASKDAIINFTYHPSLKASSCLVEQHWVNEDVNYVKLSDCPVGEEIKLVGGLS